MGYVYMITCTANDKWYIGSHNGRSKHYKGSGKTLLKAYKKYGRENFIKTILVHTDDYRGVEEQILIGLDAAGRRDMYNTTNTVSVGTDGWKGSELWLQRQKTAQLGEKHHQYGKPISDEQKVKLSAAMRKPQAKGTCVHCGRTMSINGITRHHNDNCKHAP